MVIKMVPQVSSKSVLDGGNGAWYINGGKFIPQPDYAIKVEVTGQGSATVVMLKLVMTGGPGDRFREGDITKNRCVVWWEFQGLDYIQDAVQV